MLDEKDLQARFDAIEKTACLTSNRIDNSPVQGHLVRGISLPDR